MAEQFHQWVVNMPWWEKLYYQLFNPQALSCSTYTNYWFPPPIVFIIIALVGAVATYFIYKMTIKAAREVYNNNPQPVEKKL